MSTLPAPQAAESADGQPRVWILSMGEDHEGGSIGGVYATRELGVSDFLIAAQELHDRFTLDDAHQADDGSLYASSDCDWITLKPHAVLTRPAIDQETR